MMPKPFKKTLAFYTHTAKIFLRHISNGAKHLCLRGLFPTTAVEFLVDLAKAFVGNVRVNLGGGNVRVPQQCLH